MPRYALTRGDMLSQGRYRILSQVTLPEPQQKQGRAWTAIDMQMGRRRVTLREVIVPPAMARTVPVNQIVSGLARRLQALERYEGFPQVIDVFSDGGAHYIVLLYPEGESLASLLKQQSGALPEQMVAEYGYQVCAMLTILGGQQPPIVHGSITPETIFIREENQRVFLAHLPLFPPEVPVSGGQKVSSGYYAPEQLHGEVDPSSDLYGLAATMHHAVTGYDPQERITFFHPPARRLNPAVTPQMEVILARQLSLSKSQRYTHPAEMQRELGALIASYPAPEQRQLPALIGDDPLRLSEARYRQHVRSMTMLNMGVFAAISVLLLVGVLLVILRP